MFVCCECCVLSGRGLCDELIARPDESYRLWRVVCDLENLENEGTLAHWGLLHHKQTHRIKLNSAKYRDPKLNVSIYHAGGLRYIYKALPIQSWELVKQVSGSDGYKVRRGGGVPWGGGGGSYNSRWT
jgi:hypothetical protein